MNKVFIIGLRRTGTSSIKRCLEEISMTIADSDRIGINKYATGDYSIIDILSPYDGAKDYPWALLYKELDKRYSNSYFILTTRESEDDWFRSLSYHGLRGDLNQRMNRAAINKLIIGDYHPLSNPNLFRTYYRKHNYQIRKYFRDYDKFLDLTISGNNNWEQVYDLLGITKPHPEEPINKPMDYDVYEDLLEEIDDLEHYLGVDTWNI